MTRAILVAVLVLTVCAGCTAISVDLQGAQKRLHAAQDQGLLSPTDPAPMCLDYFAGALAALNAPGSALKPPFAGVIDLGAEGYILDAMLQGGAAQDQLDKMCAPVALKILKNAGRRAPGL